jgi:hypothetical protein
MLFLEMVWAQHHCDTVGCGKVLVIDGGMKVNRKLCAARKTGIYHFKHAGMNVEVGCTNIPAPGN